MMMRLTFGRFRTSALWVLAFVAIPFSLALGSEPVEIEVTGWHDPELLAAVIDRFNQENPDVYVFQTLQNATQVLTRIAGGSPPDIYRVSWAELAEFTRQGLALDLSRLISRDADELDMGDFWPPALAAGQYQGVQYAMPHHIGGNLLWLNLDLFDNAGIIPPDENWTYDDLMSMARSISRDRDGDGEIDQWGLINPHMWAFWSGFVFSNGGHIYNHDQTAFDLDHNVTRDALRYIWELVHVAQGSPAPAQRQSDQVAWNNGNTAMVLAPAVIHQWGEVPFAHDVVPNPTGSTRRVMMGGAQPLIIYPHSPNIEAAWRFLKFINRPDIQAWVSNTLGMFPPARRSAVPYVDHPIIRSFGMELENQVVYTNMLHGTITSTFGQYIDRILRNEIPIDEAVSAINHELNVRLNDFFQ